MIRQHIWLTSSISIVCVYFVFLSAASAANDSSSFKGPLGLQLYSLRAELAKDVPGTLDKVRDFGFEYVELAGTYGMKPEKFSAELKSRGLKAISAHFPYERFRDDPDSIVKEARA